MNDTTHQVVILDNFSSPYIKQAIIVLKNFDPAMQTKIIRDAEAIVNEYMSKLPAHAPSYNVSAPKPKKHLFLRWFTAGLSILLIAGIVIFRSFA